MKLINITKSLNRETWTYDISIFITPLDESWICLSAIIGLALLVRFCSWQPRQNHVSHCFLKSRCKTLFFLKKSWISTFGQINNEEMTYPQIAILCCFSVYVFSVYLLCLIIVNYCYRSLKRTFIKSNSLI